MANLDPHRIPPHPRILDRGQRTLLEGVDTRIQRCTPPTDGILRKGVPPSVSVILVTLVWRRTATLSSSWPGPGPVPSADIGRTPPLKTTRPGLAEPRAPTSPRTSSGPVAVFLRYRFHCWMRSYRAAPRGSPTGPWPNASEPSPRPPASGAGGSDRSKGTLTTTCAPARSLVRRLGHRHRSGPRPRQEAPPGLPRLPPDDRPGSADRSGRPSGGGQLGDPLTCEGQGWAGKTAAVSAALPPDLCFWAQPRGARVRSDQPARDQAGFVPQRDPLGADHQDVHGTLQ